MKPFIAAFFAIAMGLLVSGCASTGSSGASASSSSSPASTGSGVTVFGTIDAGVSGYKTQSR
ncbi:hypothetical protein [Variovorax sp. EL159]|uniref:hypothetical protein n=1 Tax=unclassified Variovorax TaxID=663243 RepID=UPI000B89056B|nr:hypothetical protein [Variovorax sp. EL159]